MSKCVHEWETRVTAERLLQDDGFPSGWWIASETKTCACCPTFEVERFDGTRARSADEALALYREQQGVSA